MVQPIFHVWKVHVVVVHPFIQAPQHESSSRPLARTTVAARELQTLGRRPTSRLTGDTFHVHRWVSTCSSQGLHWRVLKYQSVHSILHTITTTLSFAHLLCSCNRKTTSLHRKSTNQCLCAKSDMQRKEAKRKQPLRRPCQDKVAFKLNFGNLQRICIYGLEYDASFAAKIDFLRRRLAEVWSKHRCSRKSSKLPQGSAALCCFVLHAAECQIKHGSLPSLVGKKKPQTESSDSRDLPVKTTHA